MNDALDKSTIGEIVATDFRAAGVFEQFGIDFCCGGRRSLAEACEHAAADVTAVTRALTDLPPAAAEDDADVMRWSIDRLIDHILATHHAYVRSALPVIARHLSKLVEVHGARHPELARIAALFDEMARDLLQHMMKEERVLFPYLHELSASRDAALAASPFGTVENPIRMMEREHREAGDGMRLVRELTSGYVAPPDGCTTYRVAFAELAAFERDLHRHVHLENNVLFPKSIELERRVWRRA